MLMHPQGAVARGLGQLPKVKPQLQVLTLRPTFWGTAQLPFSGMAWHVAEFEKKKQKGGKAGLRASKIPTFPQKCENCPINKN